MSDSKIDMHLPGIFSTVHLRTYWCVARRAISLVSAILLVGCRANDLVVGGGQSSSLPARFGNRINLNQIPDYGSQSIPAYIQRRNSALAISNEKALLGRVLFYDTRLSTNNRVSCASCHQQQFAFSDTSPASLGVNGRTARHSMRLVNVRFAEERRFFWDERAATLSDQLLQPVQDHVEMGFSGTGGNPGLTDLAERARSIHKRVRRLYAEGKLDASEEQRAVLDLARLLELRQKIEAARKSG